MLLLAIPRYLLLRAASAKLSGPGKLSRRHPLIGQSSARQSFLTWTVSLRVGWASLTLKPAKCSLAASPSNTSPLLPSTDGTSARAAPTKPVELQSKIKRTTS